MTLIGYILEETEANAVLASIEQAFVVRKLPPYWSPFKYQLLSGDSAGKWFVPASDADLSTPLQGNPPQTPRDFSEFGQIIAMLGGIDSRVEIDSDWLQVNGPVNFS
jgi:hypothetical protein